MKVFIFVLLAFFSLVLAIENENPEIVSVEQPPTPRLHTISSLQANAVDPSKLRVKGHIINNCPFPIYVNTAWCCPKCRTPTVKVQPHSSFHTRNEAKNDRCSQTIKVDRDPGMQGIYQIEYSMDPDGNVWYNLSSVDGEPFTDVARFLKVKDQCMWMYCKPGQTKEHCDWPFYEGFCSAGDVSFYLC